MKTQKLKIYLADLIHDRHIYNYSVPLNVGYIAAELNRRLGDSVETQIHKFPDDLISSMKSSPPDILGLSNYDWNKNLNKALISIAKKINPKIFIIMGGPNIKKKADGVKQYLLNHPSDLYVVNEGEDAFSTIIEHILGSWPCDIKKNISSSGIEFPNAAYLEAETNKLMLGKKPNSAHEKDIPFPSPWLNGMMDPFLNHKTFPLMPLLETNRNCPYQCHFCVWGDFELNKVRIFDYDTVIEEIRYIFKKSDKRFNLAITDANFGILKRDTQLAEEIRNLSDKYKNADRVFIAQAKNSVKRNLEISKILGKICIPDFAVQTLTPGVLEHSGRKNLSNDDILKYVKGVKENGHEVMTDIMLGLPGETKDQYVDSMAKVVDYGFHRASIADIRLLDGSVMAENDFREKFSIKSRFRVIPTAYGEYGGQKVVEYEECIRETNTMSEKDLLELRLFNANYFILTYLEIGRPLLDFAHSNGFHPIKIIADISKNINKNKYINLYDYCEKFINFSNNEWYSSIKEADNYYLQESVFKKLMKEGFPKLNYQYAAELISNTLLRNEFLGWVGEIIKTKVSGKDSIINELVNFCSGRVYDMPINNNSNHIEISYDSASHLANYINDHTYDVDDKKEKETYRKGEVRDSFSASNSLKDKSNNSDFIKRNFNDKSKIMIKFDSDKEKIGWLNKEIEINGGKNNLMLAIQTLLQKNQKAFLRSWNYNQ